MVVKFLDKLGNLVKSITSIAYLPVDTEPVEDSKHLITSGGVAGSISQQSSNLAPDYTKTTYPANSYVMHGGVLYTNPNAIGTAEDWDPEHWTQTTVAEMMAGAGGGTEYAQSYPIAAIEDGNYVLAGVPNRSATLAHGVSSRTYPWKITIDDDCTDAIIVLKIYNNSIQPQSIEIKRSSGMSLVLYGSKGQIVSADVTGDACGHEFTPFFNGIGRDPCSEVIIRICGTMALLSFTAV